MKEKYDVFISYSHLDRQLADDILGFLEGRGIKCFIDYRDIPRNAWWARVIPEALESSKVMLALYSSAYNKSHQVERELTLADNARIQILPFLTSPEPFERAKSYFFSNSNWIDAFPDPTKKYDVLSDDIMTIKNGTAPDAAKPRDAQPAPQPYPAPSPQSAPETVDLDQFADDYDDGVAEMQDMNYCKALRLFVHAALAGHGEAQLQMMRLCHNDFIYLSPKDAWPEIRRAADGGNAFAQYLMARYCAAVEHNDGECYEYLARSAAQGNPFGRLALARCYEVGALVPRDEVKAVDEYKDLARAGFGPAMRVLGRLYVSGNNIRKNIERGMRLLQTGAERGSVECKLELAWQRILLSADIDAARALIQECVEHGVPQALAALADTYLYNCTTGVEQTDAASLSEAFRILDRGVQKGNPQCMGKLGMFYLRFADMIGMKHDMAVALRWLNRSIELGNLQAMIFLGTAYYHGTDGLSVDKAEAWRCFMRAEGMLDGNAQYYLGKMCLEGEGRDGRVCADGIAYLENALTFSGSYGRQAARLLYSYTVPDDFETDFPTHPLSHLTADGVAKSADDALEYLRRGHSYGDSECRYLLGCALTDVARSYSDEINGITLLKQALEGPAPCLDAGYRLAHLYREGIGTPASPSAAEHYLTLAKQGYA